MKLITALKPLIDHYKLNEENLSSAVKEARGYLAKLADLEDLSDVHDCSSVGRRESFSRTT